MKHGPLIFFSIIVSFVVLSYAALPVFLAVLKAGMALCIIVGLWFLLFHWWVAPVSKTGWAPNSKVPDVTVQPRPTPSASACFKVLARRQADRLSYDSEALAEVQASLKRRL